MATKKGISKADNERIVARSAKNQADKKAEKKRFADKVAKGQAYSGKIRTK